MKKPAQVLLVVVAVLLVGTVVADRMWTAGLKQEFHTVERKRIETTNKLNTARIVYERLNHVHELVFSNMDFPGQPDTTHHEGRFFEFLTSSVNDLKMKLVSVRPQRPVTRGRVTTYTYDIEIEGDFFSFGELCSKFENSRRITTLNTFNVNLVDRAERRQGGPENRTISIRMSVDTFRVRKTAG